MVKRNFVDARRQARVPVVVLLGLYLLFAAPIALFALMPVDQLSQVALRATATAFGIAALSAVGNLLSLPVFSQTTFISVKLDAWGKSLRFIAAAATLWAALLVLVVGSIPVVFGGGSFFGGDGGGGSW